MKIFQVKDGTPYLVSRYCAICDEIELPDIIEPRIDNKKDFWICPKCCEKIRRLFWLNGEC